MKNTHIFLHSQKCGGVTLKDVMARQYDNVFDIRRFIHFEDRASDLKNLSQLEQSKIDLIQGHQFFGIHKDTDTKCQYFTLMREPVSKIISLYKSYRRKPDCPQYKNAMKYSFDEFINRKLDLHFDNGSVRVFSNMRNSEVEFGQITDENLNDAILNLRTRIYVGITEMFQESVIMLYNHLNWRSYPLYTKANFAKETDCFFVSQDTLDKIKEINRYDVRLYKYAVRLFKSQCYSIDNFDRKVSIFKFLNSTIGKLYIGRRLKRLKERKYARF